MKKSDLHFIDENEKGYSFIMQCLFKSEWEKNAENYNKFVRALIRKAADTADFVKTYLDKDTAKANGYYTEQRYQVMLERYDSSRAWYYCRENFGDKCRKTWSDAGSLKIGNDKFAVLFRNNKGDGETRYAVLSKDEFYADSIFSYQTLFEGENINIYSYDCGNEVDEVLPKGRYQVYSYEGLVAIVKLDENKQ